jgi:AraC-like DNA-binding protein
MKIQLEAISSKDSSFSLMFNPRLSDLFYWHFHPEYELVYIEATQGTRHIGDHISTYEKSDLTLIGSNIPHLNFDYGIKTDYQKVVVHFKKDFFEAHFQSTPELSSLAKLFEQSKHGIAFDVKIKADVGKKLFQLEKLKPFDQYIQILEILQILADSNDQNLLHKQPYRNKYSDRDQGRLREIYAFVDKNYHQKITLDQVAAISNLSKEAFCRYFKKASQYTFVEFLNRYRISQSKRLLMLGQSVGDACFKSGFESLSYFNRTFKKISQENPSDFRNRYL